MKRFSIVPQERQARFIEIGPQLLDDGIADGWLVSIHFDDGSSEDLRLSRYADFAWKHAEERAARLGVEVVRT